MHMRRIALQLADLFARHGHAAEAEATVTGRTRTAYPMPLAVRCGGATVLVDGDLASAATDDAAVLRLHLAALDCGAQAVYVHAGEATPAARDAAGSRVHLWPASLLPSLLGQTLWNAALGLPPPALPDPFPAPTPAAQDAPADPPALPAPPAAPEPAFIDLDGPAPPAVDLETGAEVAVTTLPTSAADELAAAEPLAAPPAAPAPATVAEAPPTTFQPTPALAPAPPAEPPLFELPPAFRPQPADPALAPLPVPDGSRGLLPARVTLDEAKRSVSDRLFGIEEWELILQPVHLFDYAVDLLRDGSLQVQTQGGRIQVNGTDRTVAATDPAACDPPPRVFAAPGLTVMDKVLRVSPERAEQIARAWAAQQHGKTVHVPTSGADGSYDLTERRTVGPGAAQVALTPLGVWHRPFWRLWGANGHVDLDAVEGHVLDQELKEPNPDVLVVE